MSSKVENKASKVSATKVKNKKLIGFFGVYTFIIVLLAVSVVFFINTNSEAAPVEDITVPVYKTGYIYKEVKEIQGTSIIEQFPELPSGCEATAAAMLLRWAGVNVNKEDVANALPKGPVPVSINGRLYGGNPNKVFVGDPFQNTGYGVYHSPIASVIDKYLPGQAVDITGKSFTDILRVIDSGRPVIVWATIDLLEPKSVMPWYDENGKKVEWKIPEHAFLLIGYSDTEVILNDPYSGKRVNKPIELFKARWEDMGKQAVTVSIKMPGKLIVTRVNDLSKGTINVEVPQKVEIQNKVQDDNNSQKLKEILDELSVVVDTLVKKGKEMFELISTM